MNKKKTIPANFFPYILLLIIFTIALFCTHVRVKTILLGYEIGKLKSKESNLLKQRSLLTMELAKLTTKTTLESLLLKKENLPSTIKKK